MITPILALSLLSGSSVSVEMLDLEKIGPSRMVRCDIDGTTRQALLEPMNFGSSILSSSNLSDTPLFNLSLSGFTSFINANGIPKYDAVSPLSDSGKKYEFVLGQTIFKDTIICVDYINEQVGFTDSNNPEIAASWLKESGIEGPINSLRIKSEKSNYWSIEGFEADGIPDTVFPMLFWNSATMNLKAKPRALDNVESNLNIPTLSGQSHAFDMGLWRNVKVNNLNLPLFVAAQKSSNAGTEQDSKNVFPLRSLGARRICLNTATKEITFIPPATREVVEGVLRTNIIMVPVHFKAEKLYIGRLPLFDDTPQSKELNGAEIISIGGVPITEINDLIDHDMSGLQKLFTQFFKRRTRGNFEFEVKTSTGNMAITVTKF